MSRTSIGCSVDISRHPALPRLLVACARPPDVSHHAIAPINGSCPSGLDTGRRLDLPLSLRRRRFIITWSVVTVETIIGLENVLDHTEGFKASFDRERGRDPGMYYLRVFGEPGKLASSTNEVPRGTSRPLTTA